MGKLTYVFIENLPKLVTKQELVTYFTNNLQEPRNVHIFVFCGENTTYDLQSAIVSFKFDNPAKMIDKLEKNTFILNNYKLQITTKPDINQFSSTAIIYDIDQKTYTNYLLPILEDVKYFNLGQIVTPPSQSLGFIIRFNSPDKIDKLICRCPDLKIKSLLSDPTPSQFSIESVKFHPIPSIHQIEPFYLIHRGKKYTVSRIYASQLSDLVNHCQSDTITLPDIEGPIELIINFLNLEEIIITPETERFLYDFASFLRIPDIIKQLSLENKQTLCIRTAPWMMHNVPPDTKQAEDLSIFLASNIEDLVDNHRLVDIPEFYLQRIVTLAAPELESHDSLIQLLIDAKVEAPITRELIKHIDPKKVSSRMLSQFFSSVTVDLNKIRNFIVAALFD